MSQCTEERAIHSVHIKDKMLRLNEKDTTPDSIFSSADKQILSQSLYRAGLFVWRPFGMWAMLRV